MKTLFAFAALLSFVLVPGRVSLAKVRVVTTLPSFADIAAQVGGDEVSVTALTRGNQDPHFVDAKPSLVLDLHKADLLIHAGLGLESGWLPPLLTGARNGKIQPGGEGDLDASSLMQLKEVPQGKLDRASGDVHPGGNPHYMLDPRNGLLLARGIADRLAKLEPSKAADFQKRAEQYSADLKGRIAGWEKRLKPLLRGRPVVTYHRSWIYFIDWTGLKEAGALEPKPGIPPSPSHLAGLMRQMKEQGVKLILMEPYYPKGAAEDVARQTGAKLLVLPTEPGGAASAKTYADVFDVIARDIQAALK